MKLKAILRAAREINHSPRQRPTEGLGPIVLGLEQYRRGPEHEARRNLFYARMATHHGFENWRRPSSRARYSESGGRDGQIDTIERFGHLTILDFKKNGIAPLEFFEAMAPDKCLLNDPWDKMTKPALVEIAKDAGARRVDMARNYSELKEDAQISPISSTNWEGTQGTGFGPRSPGEHRALSLRDLVRIERFMPSHVKATMESCFLHLNFVFDVPSKRARDMALEDLRCGLDIVGLDFGVVDEAEFRLRWPGVPIDQPALLRRIKRTSGQKTTGGAAS